MSLAQFAKFRDDGFGHAAHRAQLALERGDAPPRHLEVELFGTISGVVRAEAQPQLLGPRPAAGQLALQLGGFVDLGIQPLEVIARALGRDVLAALGTPFTSTRVSRTISTRCVAQRFGIWRVRTGRSPIMRGVGAGRSA